MTYELSSIKSEILRTKRENGDLGNNASVKEFSFHFRKASFECLANQASLRSDCTPPKMRLQQRHPQEHEARVHSENHHEDAGTESAGEGVNPGPQDAAIFAADSKST